MTSQEVAVTPQAAIAEGIAAAAVAPLGLALAAVAEEHALAKEAPALARMEASTRHTAVEMAPVEEEAVADIAQLPRMEAVAPPPDAAWSACGLCERRVTTSELASTLPGCRARHQSPAPRAAASRQHTGRARRCGAFSARRGQRHHPSGGAGRMANKRLHNPKHSARLFLLLWQLSYAKCTAGGICARARPSATYMAT